MGSTLVSSHFFARLEVELELTVNVNDGVDDLVLFHFVQRRPRGLVLKQLKQSVGHSFQHRVERASAFVRCELSLGNAVETVFKLGQELFEHGVLEVANDLVQASEHLELSWSLNEKHNRLPT